MTIQPLLTPDNYTGLVLDLINGAQSSLHIQMPYIHPSNDTNLAALIAAVTQKAQEGLEVRLIMSQYEQTQSWLERLQQAGVDLSYVRIQTNLHNKGIIVDSEIVLVSSQNWSGDGVTGNRDAGLIIYNQDAAQYWEQIFNHDWTNLAVQQALD